MIGKAKRRDATGRSPVAWPRLLAPFLFLVIAAAPADRDRVRYVTDGDTFRLVSGERIRIAGIDAPETHADQARCAAEIDLGNKAAARARALLDHREVEVIRVGRSYNRTVARVTLDGRDLATELVDNGIARWWPRGDAKPDWCAGAGSRGGRRR